MTPKIKSYLFLAFCALALGGLQIIPYWGAIAPIILLGFVTLLSFTVTALAYYFERYQ